MTELQAVIERAERALKGQEIVGAAEGLSNLVDDIISGRRKSVQFMHRNAVRLSQALLPETITILCGAPGASKSFYLLEILYDLHFSGVKVALFEIEESLEFHLRRMVAQMSGVSDFTDDEWIRRNPEQALEITEEFRPKADSFAERITCATEEPTYAMLLAWIEKEANSGARVIAIDPITLADRGKEQPWNADRSFIVKAGQIVKRTKASLILVSHPTDGKATDSTSASFMDRLAGGKSFSRSCQTMFWLEIANLPDAMIVTASGIFPPPPDKPINRVLHLCKTRNGRGNGTKLGYHFDSSTLRHHEIGILVEDKKKRR